MARRLSDAIELTIDEAGLADEAFFIDGIAVECRVLNPEFDLVTVTPNLTPAPTTGTRRKRERPTYHEWTHRPKPRGGTDPIH